jgi:two-component system CheB/CheR fusion protein
MPVREVVSGQRLRPGTVVFSPADRDLRLVGGRLFLSAKVRERGWPTTITRFVQSLARDAGPRAVAVILSGLGNDGSAGIPSIKEGGGMTVAQADAECPAMPTHAIDTGLVDAVLPGHEIGKALTVLVDTVRHRCA